MVIVVLPAGMVVMLRRGDRLACLSRWWVPP